MGIDREARRAGGEQLGHALRDQGRAVAPPDHRGIADELIEPARAGRQVGERMPLPTVDVVVLREREGAAVQFHDPHRHARITQIVGDEGLVVPPLGDVRLPSPRLQQRKIIDRDGAEAECARGPRDGARRIAATLRKGAAHHRPSPSSALARTSREPSTAPPATSRGVSALNAG